MEDRTTLGLKLVLTLAALTLCTWARPAAADFNATVIMTVNMRAGPSTAYPIVAILGTGTYVQVFGCEEGYGWCDVQTGANRGWVAAEYLQTPGPSGPAVVADSGVLLAVPIVVFSFGTYWDNYYRARPWYGHRPYYYDYWRRYPHGRPPPPPAYRPPGYRPPPPPGYRPPGNTRPPGGGNRPPPPTGGGGSRPPGGGTGPGGGPPSGGKPPGGPNTRPAPPPGQPQQQPQAR